ncbi:MAG: hypothetical protein ACKN9U_19320, partial [Pirellulaceae bacterium]
RPTWGRLARYRSNATHGGMRRQRILAAYPRPAEPTQRLKVATARRGSGSILFLLSVWALRPQQEKCCASAAGVAQDRL